jgi:hypothetical protein
LVGLPGATSVPGQFEPVDPGEPSPAFPDVTFARTRLSFAPLVANTATLDAPATVSSGDAKFTSWKTTPVSIDPLSISAV